MSDPSPPSATEQSTPSINEQEISEGRYLYCLVDTTTGKMNSLSETGIDDTPVYVIESNIVGAVVHDCTTVYDTEDLEQVKQWLLKHQQVIDAASDVFGTPLPMRFDTILKGGDASVEQWLQEHHDRIREELTAFADTWEYRIHLFWEPSVFEDHIAEQDGQLQDLRQRQQQADEGKRFLLQKQYENRLRELKQDRRADLTESLQQTVAPVVSELTEQDAHTALHDDAAADDRERVTRLAVLADGANETALGNRLDEIVEQEGVGIRFTGPWPPYTFAPDIE